MSEIPHKPPVLNGSAFNCPHCHAYANQHWGEAVSIATNWHKVVSSTKFATCAHCRKSSMWVAEKLVYPSTSLGPMPNADLPDEIKEDFQEARNIISSSPRGAAALLRLCIQKLCAHLGEPGKDINNEYCLTCKERVESTYPEES